MSEYFIIEEISYGEIVVKKSKFIGTVFPVKNEDEAASYIEKIKKQFWDAKHNCFAYIIGRNNEIQRFSDDGEPQGTAGKPILEVLTTNNMRNTLIIVTRYFGGTLLGTGGLVRAYGKTAKLALDNGIIKKVLSGISLDIIGDYSSIGKIKYILTSEEIRITNENYAEKVIISIEIKESKVKDIKTKINDSTGGKSIFENEKSIEYKEDISK